MDHDPRYVLCEKFRFYLSGELYDQDAAKLQLKVIKYVSIKIHNDYHYLPNKFFSVHSNLLCFNKTAQIVLFQDKHSLS